MNNMPLLRNRIISDSLKYIVLILLLYVPVFGYLDTLPIRIWDEGRIAVNAFEMYKNKNYIVTYFEGLPDMWNTKPPLLFWLQVICMHLVGVNEFAIRLPSALAVFGTCMAIIIFSQRYLKTFWFGFIAVILLVSSEGFVKIHVARTGDFDALLTFFETVSCLFIYTYSETKRNKYLYWFFASVTLAVFTKGVAGLLFAPAWILFILFRRQLLLFLKNPHFYAGLGIFFFLVIGFYLLRESRNPGYIATVAKNELGGRYLESQGNQPPDFWYYYQWLVKYKQADRYLLVPCGIMVAAFSAAARFRRFGLFILTAALTYFLVISFGKTRCDWYDAPLYPLISILIAFIIFLLFNWLKENEWLNRTLVINVVPYLFLFLILITPYRAVFSRLYEQKEYSWDQEFYEIGHYLQKATKGNRDMDGKYLVHDGYFAHNQFYMHMLREQGVKTRLIFPHQVEPGFIAVTCQQGTRKYLSDLFDLKEIERDGNIITYKVLEKKNEDSQRPPEVPAHPGK
jgi:4-amino-4-deoxy-L-arabinose transferase-like glycosyltransferase